MTVDKRIKDLGAKIPAVNKVLNNTQEVNTVICSTRALVGGWLIQ